MKKIIGTKFCLFINESINHVTVKNEKDYVIRIQNTDLCFYYKKKISPLELSKELFLELGKIIL